MLLVSLPLLLINELINQWESLHRDEMNQQNTKECNVKKKTNATNKVYGSKYVLFG